eukprot:3619800-Alexandrium_andersonii.AAC.1
MSASLVGSEMCIRDRGWAPCGRPVFAWLIKDTGDAFSKYSVGEDGETLRGPLWETGLRRGARVRRAADL